MPSATPASDRWIVLKFGGTSVSRRHRWNTIGKLAKQRADEQGARVLVVVSALSGVTNELTAIADGAADSAETTTSTRTPSSDMRFPARRPMVSQRLRRDTEVPPNLSTTQRFASATATAL